MTGALGGALGSWVARGPRWGRWMGFALAVVLVLGCEHAIRGDDILEGWSTRRVRQQAEAGDPEAMLDLARRLEYGVDRLWGTQSPREGLVWYRRAAEAGNVEAMFALAVRLQDGRAPVNLVEAREWLSRAAALGYPPARERWVPR